MRDSIGRDSSWGTRGATLALLLAALLAPATVADAAKTRTCGSVTVDLPQGSEGSAVNVRATGVTCSRARQVARACLRGRDSGWNARLTSGGDFVLDKGRARVRFTPAGGGGCT